MVWCEHVSKIFEKDELYTVPVHADNYLLANERSERDTYRGNTIENRECLFIYIYVWTYVCHFVL